MARKSRPRAQKRPDVAKHRRLAAEKFAAGDAVLAAKHCRQALKTDQQAADLWHLLAASLLQQNDGHGAHEAAHQACLLAPDNLEYKNTEALTFERCGEVDAAGTIFKAILAVQAGHADASYNLGRLLLAAQSWQDAANHFQNALRARPQWVAAWKNLGHACFGAREFTAALQAFEQALRIDANDSETLLNLARLAQQHDNFELAAEFLQRAIAIEPDAASLLRLSVLHPIFCSNSDEIAQHRQRIEHNLKSLMGESLPLDEPHQTLGAPAFYLAYHGLNDCSVMQQFGAIVEAGWQPKALPPIGRARQQPRLALVSAHFKHHAIGRLYAPLIERLSGRGFELAVLSVGQHHDEFTARIMAAADVAAATPLEYHAARQALHELDADAVFFPDVGMEAVTYWLAAERHAPVQALGWGHPVTSGFTSLDYFISSQWLEPDGAAEHYSEQLYELDSWPVCYDNPGAPPEAGFLRADFDLKPAQPLYLCPQSLFKFHPDFDAYLGAILAQDKDAQIALVSNNSAWNQRLQQRFSTSIGQAAKRIKFLPALSQSAFYAAIGDADVVLDTIHFSGGITSFETIWAETPFVSERAPFMRGRVTAGLCDLIDLPEALTVGAAAYAERAVQLAHAGPAREHFIQHLAEHKWRLLDFNDAVAQAYVSFFEQAINSNARQRAAAVVA